MATITIGGMVLLYFPLHWSGLHAWYAGIFTRKYMQNPLGFALKEWYEGNEKFFGLINLSGRQFTDGTVDFNTRVFASICKKLAETLPALRTHPLSRGTQLKSLCF